MIFISNRNSISILKRECVLKYRVNPFYKYWRRKFPFESPDIMCWERRPLFSTLFSCLDQRKSSAWSLRGYFEWDVPPFQSASLPAGKGRSRYNMLREKAKTLRVFLFYFSSLPGSKLPEAPKNKKAKSFDLAFSHLYWRRDLNPYALMGIGF